MKTKKYFEKKYILILLAISFLLLSCSLYYKQYLPISLIHPIVILLIMFFISIPFIYKKYKKRQTLINSILILISTISLGMSVMIINHNDKLSTENHYIGIDISKWNDSVDLRLANQEIDYVIIRCGYTSLTDGTTTKEDPFFRQNVQQCLELSIPYGIYYYSLAKDATQAKKEADFVSSLLTDKIPPLGVFMDLEDEDFQGNLSNGELTTVATTFLDNLNPNYKKGIYANHYWWSTKLTDSIFDQYLKWKARYNDTKELEEHYDILQYSETGSIKGISGNVDMNMVTTKYWLNNPER